jgi:serine/threonine protein kinase
VDALRAGRPVARAQFLAANPDFRVELEAFFAGHDEVERVAAPLREATGFSGPRGSIHGPLGQLGEFRLLREVGRGGMGVVYEAEQLSLRRRVALKVLPFAAAIDPRRLQRFKNEALAAANLRHEHIVAVYGVGTELGVHYYAMQFVEGRSLAELIAALRTPCAPAAPVACPGAETVAGPTVRATRAGDDLLTAVQRDRSTGQRRYYNWVATLGRQAALALEYAHQTGVIHRDVKPANLLLDARGQLWVTDFGLAQVAGDSGLTMTGEILGTLRYASPEQVQARRGLVDHRTDVYSLGATLYELLTLRTIYEGADRHELLRRIADEDPLPPRAVTASVPAELETIVLKALAKDPADRYASAQDFADDLQRYVEDRPIRARRPGRWERYRKWARRHPSLVVAVGALLLLLSAGSLVSAALINSERHKAEAAYLRERDRADEAEAQYRLARRSVDELFRLSEEELADKPGTEALRKRLLTSVLAYYREFIEQRRDDPAAQASLFEARERTEKLLADLAVLRAAGQIRLLSQPPVLDDLRLDTDQRARIETLTNRVEQQWKANFPEFCRAPPAERARRSLEQARANEKDLRVILTPEQFARLSQIGLQSDVIGAFREPDVAAELRFTVAQREQLHVIEGDAFLERVRTFKADIADKLPPPNPRTPNERALALLTAEQARTWRELTGPPFRGTVHTPHVGPGGP